MKTAVRILIILLAAALISEAAGLIVKATDPGAPTGSVKQASTASNGGKTLNSKQPSAGGSGSNQNAVGTFSIGETPKNILIVGLFVTGVWSIERLIKNKRRKKFVRASSFREPVDAIEYPWSGGKRFLPQICFRSKGEG